MLKVSFESPRPSFWGPNVPLWVRMPPTGQRRGGPKAPGRLSLWGHPPSWGFCLAEPAAEPPPPRTPTALTMARPRCLERGDRGSSGGGSSCSSPSSAARPRLHTHCPQRAPPLPPPPAPTVPQRPPRAPRLARPRPAGPRAAALRLRGSLRGPPRAAGPAHLPSRPAEGRALPPRAALCRRPRARPPRDYFPSPRPLRTTSLPAEGHARRRVTRPCESRAVIGPEAWRK